MSLNNRPLKSVVKAPQPMVVLCKLKDCIFHEGSPEGDAEVCRCSHPYKPQEAKAPKCALYQLDFMKKMAQFSRAK